MKISNKNERTKLRYYKYKIYWYYTEIIFLVFSSSYLNKKIDTTFMETMQYNVYILSEFMQIELMNY